MTSEWRDRLMALQNKMKGRLDHTPTVSAVKFAAGCDLTVEGDIMVGCFVVVDVENQCKSVYEKCSIVDVDVPYIPGLLCFREGPVVLACLREFQSEFPDMKLDILLVDGNGEWHPRGFGLGCYVGLECGIPTLGVSKTFLNTQSGHTGKQVQVDAQSACANVGDVMLLHHVLDDGSSIDCAVMRTTTSVPFKPVFISAGHLVNINSAIQIVRDLCIFREPEPLRLADRISREFVRNMKKKASKK
jgi:deoxyinosine 3'endonuclease (endonuclease V)